MALFISLEVLRIIIIIKSISFVPHLFLKSLDQSYQTSSHSQSELTQTSFVCFLNRLGSNVLVRFQIDLLKHFFCAFCCDLINFRTSSWLCWPVRIFKTPSLKSRFSCLTIFAILISIRVNFAIKLVLFFWNSWATKSHLLCGCMHWLEITAQVFLAF